MFIVGFDLGKRKSQLCVQDEDGKVLAELRINTVSAEIVAAVGKYRPVRVLIEASTSSDWIARLLESVGCEVIVADPRFSLMYAQRDKKVKNDRRDARALADALRLKAYRRAHRRSELARQLHGKLLVRNKLLGARTKMINLVRSLCEREGVILPSCRTGDFSDLVEGLEMDETLFAVVSPALVQITSLTTQIDECTKELEVVAAAHPVARMLQSVRGIGPMTSLAFIAVVDDPKRFKDARELSSYLGLVPGENNSGDSKRAPHAITKSGDPLLRAYLVEAAFALTNKRAPPSHLKDWYTKLTKGKKSKKRAAVAVARRLARILWAMWRDNKPFDESRTAPFAPRPPKTAQALPKPKPQKKAPKVPKVPKPGREAA